MATIIHLCQVPSEFFQEERENPKPLVWFWYLSIVYTEWLRSVWDFKRSLGAIKKYVIIFGGGGEVQQQYRQGIKETPDFC